MAKIGVCESDPTAIAKQKEVEDALSAVREVIEFETKEVLSKLETLFIEAFHDDFRDPYDQFDEVAIQSLEANKEKGFVDFSKENLDLGDKNEEIEAAVKKRFGQTYDLIKKRWGDSEKVVNDNISNRLGYSPSLLRSPEFRWSAHMRSLTKAESDGDTTSLEDIKGKKICSPQDHKSEKSKHPIPSASVVKISTNTRTVDPLYPWCAPINKQFVGSGFVISGQKILTNAHVVTGATLVEVKKPNSGTKYKAEIIAFGHDCDLALLTIKDREFWNDLKPLELIEHMPKLFEKVSIVGYPLGGDGISITSGIISRVNTQSYTHNKKFLPLPVLQVDAAINGGNSGGPVFVGNDVIGVAFESLIDAANIGYVIPSPIVKLFLAGVERRCVGFCSLGCSIQGIENHMMRKCFKMSEGMTGVLVTRSTEKGKETLKKNDVLLEVDELPIQDDETVCYMNKFWIHLSGYVALKKPEESVSLKILRMGEVENITMKLTWVLEGDINKGYTSFSDLMVNSVDGIKVYSLEQLCKVIAEASTDYLKIDLEMNLVIILDIKEVMECNHRILNRHKVMDGISKDLKYDFGHIFQL